jgi:hypothetical protein
LSLFTLWQAGPIEKTMIVENFDGSAANARIVFHHSDSVMYATAYLNGHLLAHHPVKIRPLM